METFKTFCLSMMLGLFIGYFITNEEWKKSCVAVGSAIYYKDPQGYTRWRWLYPPPPLSPNMGVTIPNKSIKMPDYFHFESTIGETI